MKRIDLFNGICILISSILYCYIYTFKLNMSNIQTEFYNYLDTATGQPPEFIATLKEIFVPDAYLSTLTLFFLALLILTIILFAGIILLKRSVVLTVGALGIVLLACSGYNLYSSDNSFNENHTTISNVYNEYQKDMPAFDKQIYEESLTRFKNYEADNTIENRIKAETSFTMILVLKSFIQDLTPEQLALFQEGLKKDVKFSINNDYAYIYGTLYIFLIFCLLPICWVIFTRKPIIKETVKS